MEWKYKTIEKDGFSFLVATNESNGPHLFWLGSAVYYPRVIPDTLAEAFKITIVDHRGLPNDWMKRKKPNLFTILIQCSLIFLRSKTNYKSLPAPSLVTPDMGIWLLRMPNNSQPK